MFFKSVFLLEPCKIISCSVRGLILTHCLVVQIPSLLLTDVEQITVPLCAPVSSSVNVKLTQNPCTVFIAALFMIAKT